MLPISKLPEPPGLKKYKAEYPDSDHYDDFRNDKAAFIELRENLLKEQKYVCAYCGQSLSEDIYKMKTEHFNPQTDKLKLSASDPYHNLDYHNLLACCLGNDDHKGENHCDSAKKDIKLEHIPNPAFIQSRNPSIKYKVNARSEEVLIFSPDSALHEELDKTLNLNHDRLRTSRFNQWKRVTRHLGEAKEWKAAKLKQVIEDYQVLIDGKKHQEFKDFIIWYVNDWIRRFG